MRAALLAALAVCAAEGTAPSSPGVTYAPATYSTSTRTPSGWYTPVPSPATVHYMSAYGSVDNYYSTPQEWDISCSPYSTLIFNVKTSVSRYTLAASYKSLSYGNGQYVSCPSNGKLKLVYTPDPNSGSDVHFVHVSWYPHPTDAPSTRTPGYTPVPSATTVHYMSDTASIDNYYSTPQEWDIPCTPYSAFVFNVKTSVSGYRLVASYLSLDYGYDQSVICPYNGKLKLVYTPETSGSHLVSVSWYPRPTYAPTRTPPVPTPSPGTVHYMSDSGSIHDYYYGTQVWVITCRSYSTLYVTVTELSGTLTADTTTLYSGVDHYPVSCPYTGQLNLKYVPYSDTAQFLGVRWSPDAGDDSQSISPLLIALVVTAGLLVLVGVTVAVYCGCRGKAADPNAYSSNVQVEGYADVVHTGGFGGLQDSSSPPVGQQPMCEMNEQMPVAEIAPL